MTRSGSGGIGSVVARSAVISTSAPRSSTSLVEGLRGGDERPLAGSFCAASSSASTRSSASSTGLDGSSATSAAWSGVFSSCATSAAKSSSASLRRASWIVVRARRSSAARRRRIGASRHQCRLDLPSRGRPPWRTSTPARPSGRLSHAPQSGSRRSGELERAVVAHRPPLDARGARVAANPFDHADHARCEVVGGRERRGRCRARVSHARATRGEPEIR